MFCYFKKKCYRQSEKILTPTPNAMGWVMRNGVVVGKELRIQRFSSNSLLTYQYLCILDLICQNYKWLFKIM